MHLKYKCNLFLTTDNKIFYEKSFTFILYLDLRLLNAFKSDKSEGRILVSRCILNMPD